MGFYADPHKDPFHFLYFINWTPNANWSSVQNMGIDHRRFDIIMAKKFLDGIQRSAVSVQPSAKCVASPLLFSRQIISL